METNLFLPLFISTLVYVPINRPEPSNRLQPPSLEQATSKDLLVNPSTSSKGPTLPLGSCLWSSVQPFKGWQTRTCFIMWTLQAFGEEARGTGRDGEDIGPAPGGTRKGWRCGCISCDIQRMTCTNLHCTEIHVYPCPILPPHNACQRMLIVIFSQD